jgi:6-methylsalicylate decarboxylase
MAAPLRFHKAALDLGRRIREVRIERSQAAQRGGNMATFFATEAGTGSAVDCACCAVSRRGFLKGSAAAVGAASLATGAFAQTAARRIDTHHHYYPPAVQNFPGVANPLIAAWSPAKSLEEMDKNGVRTGILSMASAPLAWFRMQTEESRKFVRGINDYGAKMVADKPGRYGLFAFLSMVDVEGSLKEIEYALDTLKADGIGISTVYVDKYPGDKSFAPIFEELNRRKAVVYFHPTTAACCAGYVPGVGDSWAEVPHDTTRAVLSLMFSGSLRKYRDIKFLWSHGGGTIPMIAGRIDWLSKVQIKNRNELMPDGVEAELRRMWYDTANAGYASSMAAMLKILPPSQIVFGTDYPYVTTEWNLKALRGAGVSDDMIRAIETENARALVPRLA